MSLLRSLLLAATLLLGVAAPAASAATRFAVPGGTGTSTTCTFQTDDCSLKWVLENVVGASDEVVVTPGTHDFGTSPVNVRSAGRPLNIHGQDGQPRPSVVADAAYVLSSCNPSPCVDDDTVFRHLRIENKSRGSGLLLSGGSVGHAPTVDDVVVVLGTAGAVFGNGLLIGGRTGIAAYAFVRNTTVHAPGDNQFAIGSGANLTLRNVTAVATGSSSYALSQGANCVPGDCTHDAESNVFNSILDGAAGDVRTILSFNNHTANVALDYSNFDSVDVSQCAGCTVSGPGSAHNQTAAALLVNKAAGDFHETAGSPTIDAGIDDPANGSTDPDGNARKLGAATDIGAFETAGSGTTTPTDTNTPNGTTISPIQLTVGGVTLTLNLPTVLKVKGKYVTIPFVCPLGVLGNCTGTIKIVTASKVLVKPVAAKKKRKLTLGKASFSVPSGQTKNVKVKLSKAALKLLAAKGKVKAVVTLRATANGATKSANKKVTVKGKKKRR